MPVRASCPGASGSRLASGHSASRSPLTASLSWNRSSGYTCPKPVSPFPSPGSFRAPLPPRAPETLVSQSPCWRDRAASDWSLLGALSDALIKQGKVVFLWGMRCFPRRIWASADLPYSNRASQYVIKPLECSSQWPWNMGALNFRGKTHPRTKGTKPPSHPEKL